MPQNEQVAAHLFSINEQVNGLSIDELGHLWIQGAIMP
jgi:hypothetical protein